MNRKQGSRIEEAGLAPGFFFCLEGNRDQNLTPIPTLTE